MAELINYDDGGLFYDEEIILSYDQGTEPTERNIYEDFATTIAGIGTKHPFSYLYPNIMVNVLLYSSFDEPNGDIVEDYSANNYLGTIFGDTTQRDRIGISGYSLLLNGTNNYVLYDDVIFFDSDKDITFWVQAIASEQTTTLVPILYKAGTIAVYYNTTTGQLETTIYGNLGDNSGTYTFDLLDGLPHFIDIQIDKGTTTCTPYIDDVAGPPFSIITVGDIGGTSDIVFGANSTFTTFYKGYIDEFKLYGRTLLTDERSFLYDYKIGGYKYLEHEVYREALSLNEVYEENNNYYIFSRVPIGHISNRLIGTGDGVTINFTYASEFPPIVEKSAKISYINKISGIEETVFDNGDGLFIGNDKEGTIDYVTGAIDITFEKDNTINGELVASGSVSNISLILSNANLVPSTVSVTFYYDSTLTTITDDGVGGFFAATGVDSASIDYVTGELIIVFTGPTDVDQDITTNYQYTWYSTPADLSEIKLSYTTEQDLPITEIGIENVNGEMVAYATLPIAEMSVDNHIGFQFIVQR